MHHILPLSTGELLAFAFVCGCVGVSIGIAIAGWIATRDPTTAALSTPTTAAAHAPHTSRTPQVPELI